MCTAVHNTVDRDALQCALSSRHMHAHTCKKLASCSHLEVLLVRAVRIGVGGPLLDCLLVASGLQLALEVERLVAVDELVRLVVADT